MLQPNLIAPSSLLSPLAAPQGYHPEFFITAPYKFFFVAFGCWFLFYIQSCFATALPLPDKLADKIHPEGSCNNLFCPSTMGTNPDVEARVSGDNTTMEAGNKAAEYNNANETMPPNGLVEEKEPEPSFDTGFKPWIQVFGSFFCFFNSW